MALTVVQNARATFVLDGSTFTAQLKNVTMTTDANGGGQGEKTLSGETIPDPLTFVDRITGTVVQDWPAAGGGLIGFSRKTANRGKVVPFTLTAVEPAGYAATGTVQVTPLDLTIDPNGSAESAVDWQLITLDETYPAAAAPGDADA